VNDVNDYMILSEDILQGILKNEPTLFYNLQVNLDDCKLLLTRFHVNNYIFVISC